MNLPISELDQWFTVHRQTLLSDFFQFLSFKSISTDPSHASDCIACANWLVAYLKKMGLEATLWPSSSMPVVFAQSKPIPGKPTLLIYHHYDVQPVDPIELWESDPFEPILREETVYARGAADNKGQCFYTLSAIRAHLALKGTLPFNLKLLIEGEEESGSRGTEELLESRAEELKSDALLVIDSGMLEPGIGAVTLGVRGIVTAEVVCKCADIDMHSGALGGVAYNPIRALSVALGALWDEKGRVAIAEFYDAVRPISDQEKEGLHLTLDEEKLRAQLGLRLICPEPGYSIGESVAIRPTLEINGIAGGYAGKGFKTVIPAEARAKISCRLVPDQEPELIFADLKKYLLKQFPDGMEVDITYLGGAPAFRSDPQSSLVKLVGAAYEEVLGTPCQRILMGGSIPIIPKLVAASGAEALMMGYGLNGDQIHAPNEHFGWDRVRLGFLTIGQILSRFDENE